MINHFVNELTFDSQQFKMIVIFHLTVYFAYHVWDTYISSLFTNNDNGTSSNTGNGNVSPDNASNSARPQDISQNIESNQRENIELRSNKDPISETRPPINRSGGTQSKEGEGDLPQVVKLIQFQENEEGRKCIYDVKPKFMCIQESEEKGMKFSPPVYVQRYMIIEGILKEPHWAESIKKVCGLLSALYKGNVEGLFRGLATSRLHSLGKLRMGKG